MKLKKGDKAIGFKTEDIMGNKIELKDFPGKKVLLSFYRGASCPFCNLRVHELIKNFDVLREKELVIIGVFTSERQEIMEFVGKQNPPFPIIADPEETFYKMYGLEKSFAGKMKAMLRVGSLMKIFANGFMNSRSFKDDNTLPGDFLIDEKGMVEVAYYGKDFGDHIDFRIINDWLNKKNEKQEK